ncbi:MAG: hypothetical protein AB7I27_08995 [Bacteriovoracaceae bacterium]
MKKKSNQKNEIKCKYWETPVVNSENLWLARILSTDKYTFFFFVKNHYLPGNEFYVLTIGGGGYEPFKITEEGLGWKTVGGLLKNKIPSKRKKGSTYKVWNTPFAKMTFGALPITTKEYEQKDKFQYVIRTNDTWIEFVSFVPPIWEHHKGIKLDRLVIQYLKKDPWE